MDSVRIDPLTVSPWALALSSAIAGIILLLCFPLIRRRRSNLPPGPPWWPVVGNLLQLGKKPHQSLFLLAKKYGPLMALRLGTKTAVVVSSPAMAREVLKNNDQVFAGRIVLQVARCVSYYKSSMVWTQYGPRWRMYRKMCTSELFSATRLNALQHLRRDQVANTIRLIYEEDYLKGKMVNIGHTAFLTSLNLLGNMVFTRNIFGRDSEAAEELKETASKLMVFSGTPNAADFLPFLQFLDPQGISRGMTANLKRMFQWFDKFVEDRLSNTTDTARAEKDFLDVLLEHRSDGDGDGGGDNVKFSRADMLPFMTDVFIAGSETTATTIEWAMAELLRNPQMMKRAQEELDEAVGRHRKVEESEALRLPYLQAVVKEVFRMHPAVPLMIPHRADQTCEVAGFVVPKDSQVIVNVWGMGRDPSVWKEPSEFNPDRFLGSDIDFKGNHLELIPFGAGRRMCPGIPLANRMVHFAIASLLQSFDWSLPDGQTPQQVDMSEKPGLTLQKAEPLMAIPTPRLSSSLY